MNEDLFAWAARTERNAARRNARRQQYEARRAATHPSAEIIDFPNRRWQRMDRLLDSALAAHQRSEQRAAGAMPPAPILPFDGDRKQA